MFKKIIVHTRRSIKIVVLSIIAIFLIFASVMFLYKPTYSVFINGEQVGYTEDKAGLQHKINDFIEKGEENNQNVAFIQVEKLPEYKICLLKKNIVSNDEDIINMVKEQGVAYYRYYAILNNNEEKIYVSNFEQAENVINQLKEKNSNNIDSISIVEKYETEMKTLKTSEEAISELYVEKPKVVVAKTSNTKRSMAIGSVNTTGTLSSMKVSLGVDLVRPVSGTITSRFGANSSIRSGAHTGLDIANATGTPIYSSASGTVTFSGYKGSYGNLIVVSHGNGVQTYYGHCSKLYVSTGTVVSQGQTIGTVGSTGNSTGPHLHFEVRLNGVAYNPQNYVY